MPDLNGFDVATELKSDPDTRNIPILIVSVTDDRKQMFQIGVDDYLTKPFNEEMIIEKVTNLLRNPKGTILVVDDDDNLVRSIEFELKQRGYSTSIAHNGEEALSIVKENPPDLIVLDIMMPKIDGHAVIKNL